MTKISPQFVNGLKFVRASELPLDQSEILSTLMSDQGFMKVNVEGVEWNDCIDYEDYDYWYGSYTGSKLELEF